MRVPRVSPGRRASPLAGAARTDHGNHVALHFGRHRALQDLDVHHHAPGVLDLAQNTLYPSQRPGLDAHPLADAQVRTDVRRVDDGQPTGNAVLEPRGGQPGEYQAAIPGLAAGEYEAEAVATHGGQEVGRARVRFTVDAYSIEFADARQDVDFLREIAARTGGRSVGPEAVAGLVRDLPHAARDIVVRSEIELWNTTPLFVLFVVALGVEWLMRKRFGLL